MDGPDLLVGNSATPSNNHMELFQLLKSLDLEGRRLIVPLSYGDIQYADHVVALGQRMFGSRFVPLRDFLSADAFAEKIATCGFVFMNHVRQQATGNVTLSLFKGAKVFLRPANLLSHFYRRLGAVIEDIPEGNVPASSYLLAPLDDEVRTHNRQVIMDYWSERVVLGQVRGLAALIQARKHNAN